MAKKKTPVKRARPKPKPVKRAKPASRSASRNRGNRMAKRHKQKLLDAKLNRQRQRNRQIMQMRRKNEQRMRSKQKQNKKDGKKDDKEEQDAGMDEDAIFTEQQLREDSPWRRFCMFLEDTLASLVYFLTVTLRSERTLDWLVFLANNLGLFQEYEINDYGQRLSPRTGRPVLLSLGPFRVVQVVESSNQIRSHWDPYIRDYLRNSKLTTDCWRANRMALTVALCMDDTGQMFDMPIYNSALRKDQLGKVKPSSSN